MTSNPSLAQLADILAWLTVLTYLAAAVPLNLELGYRLRWPGLAGVAVAVAGLALNAGAATARGLAAGRVPWGNLYEVSILLGLVLVAGYLVWVWRRPETRSLGPFVLLPAVLAIAAGGLLAYVSAGPLVPALNSGWLRIHVAAAIIGCSVLALSGLFSVLFLGKDRMERRAMVRPPLVAGGARTADRAQVAQRLADHVDTGVPGDVDAADVLGKPGRSLWTRLPAAQPWMSWPTAPPRSPSRSGPSGSSPGPSGGKPPGAATGAGIPRRPGRSSSGCCMPPASTPGRRPGGGAGAPPGSAPSGWPRSPSTCTRSTSGWPACTPTPPDQPPWTTSRRLR